MPVPYGFLPFQRRDRTIKPWDQTLNASDIMRGMDEGLSRFKFFPATTAGGMKALQALAAPFSKARFCPMGGVTRETIEQWLALNSVLCVGGSWLTPAGASPTEITQRAALAFGAGRSG
ncbi:hypothetical protein ACVOMT_23275 (plasmid) [Sphingomonas panni]|uniref:hypothetical protein n=1 Tax=Sphingomonas hankookensis TaxID=563996 RepID=UPI003D302F32